MILTNKSLKCALSAQSVYKNNSGIVRSNQFKHRAFTSARKIFELTRKLMAAFLRDAAYETFSFSPRIWQFYEEFLLTFLKYFFKFPNLDSVRSRAITWQRHSSGGTCVCAAG
jgi:hypothetical protein